MYAGTNENTHGDKNEASPAKNDIPTVTSAMILRL
jgi:hypothetical protein